MAAVIAGATSFGGVAATAGSMAQILFFIFVALFLLSLVGGLVRRR